MNADNQLPDLRDICCSSQPLPCPRTPVESTVVLINGHRRPLCRSDCRGLGNRAVIMSGVDSYRQGPAPANRSGVIRMMKPGGGWSIGGNFTSGPR